MNPGDTVEFGSVHRPKRGTVTRVLKKTVWVKDSRGRDWVVDKSSVRAIDNTTQQS